MQTEPSTPSISSQEDPKFVAFKNKLDQWEIEESHADNEHKAEIKAVKHEILTYYQRYRNNDPLALMIISNRRLKIIPEALGDIESLEVLDLSFNQFTKIPDWIFNLKNLKKLNLSRNTISELSINSNPDSNLTELDLSHNSLTKVPTGIENLSKLESLDLQSNQIKILNTEELQKISNLKSLSIAINKLIIDQKHSLLRTNSKLEITDYDNPYSTKSFISFLIECADLSQGDKKMDYKTFFERHGLQDRQDQFESSENLHEEDLNLRLEKASNYFTSELMQHPVYKTYGENFINAIKYFFIEDTKLVFEQNEEANKNLARDLLAIFSEIYENRNDETFLKRVNDISQKYLSESRDDGADGLLIVNLRELIKGQKKTSSIESPDLISNLPLTPDIKVKEDIEQPEPVKGGPSEFTRRLLDVARSQELSYFRHELWRDSHEDQSTKPDNDDEISQLSSDNPVKGEINEILESQSESLVRNFNQESLALIPYVEAKKISQASNSLQIYPFGRRDVRDGSNRISPDAFNAINRFLLFSNSIPRGLSSQSTIPRGLSSQSTMQIEHPILFSSRKIQLNPAAIEDSSDYKDVGITDASKSSDLPENTKQKTSLQMTLTNSSPKDSDVIPEILTITSESNNSSQARMTSQSLALVVAKNKEETPSHSPMGVLCWRCLSTIIKKISTL